MKTVVFKGVSTVVPTPPKIGRKLDPAGDSRGSWNFGIPTQHSIQQVALNVLRFVTPYIR